MAMRHLSRGRLAMDRNGQWAARGQPSERLLDRWLTHDYFAQPPPKSTGREVFRGAVFQYRIAPDAAPFALRPGGDPDRIHRPFRCAELPPASGGAPGQIILTGGGASNPTLVRAIAAQFSDGAAVEVVTSEALAGRASH